MKYRIPGACAVAFLLVGLVGCSLFSEREERGEHHTVTLSDLPAAVRATVDRQTAGGTIKKIDRESKEGSVVYGVEATVGSKDVEYRVDDSGKVLTSEEEALQDQSGPEGLKATEGGQDVQKGAQHDGRGEGDAGESEKE
jgi:hypothetical protein